MKKKSLAIVIIYLILCLGISNLLWVLAYSNPEADGSMLFAMLAAFFPMLLALIMAKITGEGWNHLGIAFHFRKWRYYLIAVLGTILLVYGSNPLMLLLFPAEVRSSFSPDRIGEILLMVLLGILCFIECLGEELGWIGYLFPKLEELVGTTGSILLLGLIRGCYHIGLLSFMDYPVQGFVELTISNILLQSFMVYLYKQSGSLFPCTIMHGISNLLPILLVYDNNWYYHSFFAMAVNMVPTAIIGIACYLIMKKKEILCKRTYS